jgi:hypothetical protein
MIRREAFEQVGHFKDLRTAEDYEWLLRMASRYPANYVPEPLVLMREHAGRTTHKLHELPLLDYITVVEAFLAANPELPRAVRARGRRGLANVHYKLARLYIESGEGEKARQHLWAMLRRKPLDRRAPASWLQALAPHNNKRPPTTAPQPDEQPGERP